MNTRRAFVRKIDRALGSVEGATIAVWGLAFKSNTDDLRDAPSLDIIRDLLARGARVRAYDPAAMGAARAILPHVAFCADAYDAANVMIDAMKRANSVDPKVYTPELIKANYKGVTTTIQFEPNGELKNPAITLYVYKDGKKTALN